MRPTARIRLGSLRAALRARAAALVAAVALAGCAGGSKPSADVTWTGLRDLGVLGATIEIEVTIENPDDAPLEVGSIDWALTSAGRPFASGSDDLSTTVGAASDRAFVVPARVAFRDLLAADESVAPGSVIDYTADIEVRGDGARDAISCSGSGRLPLPISPGVRLERVHWRLVTPDAARAVLAIWMKNRNAFPIELSTLDYRLALSSRQIVEEALSQPRRLDPGEEVVLEIAITLSPRDLGLTVFNLQGGDDAAYELSGTLGCRTPFGPVDLPFDARGRTAYVR